MPGLAHGLGHVIQVQDGKTREEAVDEGDRVGSVSSGTAAVGDD
jgi:hypothetical protein